MAGSLSPAELYGLVSARRRSFRRTVALAAWVLAQLQWIVVRGVATGISIAFGDKKQPDYLTPKQLFDTAPFFDVTVPEDADDGR